MAKRFAVTVALAIMVTTGVAQAAERSEYFVGINLGRSMSHMNSGGLNTAGPHQNTGDDSDMHTPVAEISVGKMIGAWRTEFSLATRHPFEFTTNSFAPPVPTFFYQSNINSRSAMLSLYYDLLLGSEQRWMPYIGAGAGGARTKVEIDDGVVYGRGEETSFVWQVGAGIGYKVCEAVDIQAGYRYVDLGKTDIKISDGIFGNFTADLITHEILAGVRMKF